MEKNKTWDYWDSFYKWSATMDHDDVPSVERSFRCGYDYGVKESQAEKEKRFIDTADYVELLKLLGQIRFENIPNSSISGQKIHMILDEISGLLT